MITIEKNTSVTTADSNTYDIFPPKPTSRHIAPDAHSFLSAFWSSANLSHQIGTLDRPTGKFKNIPVSIIDDALARAFSLSKSGTETYFACAEYINSRSRTAANVAGASAFWMDIDCGEDKAKAGKGYVNEAVAEEALIQFCKKADLPAPTHIVLSGGGLHVYWALDGLITREIWQAFAKKLKALTKDYGFLADDTRTADIASVLRIPGTLNYKYSPPKPITLKFVANKPILQSVMFDAIDMAFNQLNVAAGLKLPKHKTDLTYQNTTPVASSTNIEHIRTLLSHIDPDCSRHDWINAGMAISYESRGSEIGFQLWNGWSAKGKKYSSEREVRVQWDSFNKTVVDHPITIATIFKIATDQGLNPTELIATDYSMFDTFETVVVKHGQVSPKLDTKTSKPSGEKANPFDKYSLKGRSAELEKQTVEQVFILGQIALKGQSTIIYASPNTGKTLLTMHLIVAGIKLGNINPSKLYYLNMDDTGTGLLGKLHLAEEYGFHMLSEGHRDFAVSKFLGIVTDMVESDQCRDVIIVLDTLKKFTNLMDKVSSSSFSNVIRRFIVKGGTLVALAHTNKKLGPDGLPVYSGTTDIIDDSDCAYIIAPIASSDGSNEKVVEFLNMKRRGNVVLKAAYSYTIENEATYNEILLSVCLVDPKQIDVIKQVEALKSNAEMIAAVQNCISEGINTKMKLVDAVAAKTSCSKRYSLKIIEQHTGIDPAIHKWDFKVCERGAKVFCILEMPQT